MYISKYIVMNNSWLMVNLQDFFPFTTYYLAHVINLPTQWIGCLLFCSSINHTVFAWMILCDISQFSFCIQLYFYNWECLYFNIPTQRCHSCSMWDLYCYPDYHIFSLQAVLFLKMVKCVCNGLFSMNCDFSQCS